MYDAKISGYVRRNGVRYKPGDIIQGLTEREVQGLVKLGVAAKVTPSAAVSGSNLAQSAPDPSTPWGLVALPAAEAAAEVAKVDSLKFLRAVEALEELREKPRATVLRAIEARRRELEPSASPDAGNPPEPADGSDDGGSGLAGNTE